MYRYAVGTKIQHVLHKNTVVILLWGKSFCIEYVVLFVMHSVMTGSIILSAICHISHPNVYTYHALLFTIFVLRDAHAYYYNAHTHMDTHKLNMQ